MAELRLHNFFRNSAGHRVRIALALKGLDYDYVSVNIGPPGEQKSENYLRLNPQGLVPALEHNGAVITQSSAIIEYLEEVFPEPPLLPADPLIRARARAFAAAIAAEMHALNNSGVHRYLASEMGLDEAQRQSWYAHWAGKGFSALETLLAAGPDRPFCAGDAPTIADIFLVPQHLNYRRFNIDLSPYPRINRIVARCEALPPFQAAAPEAQPDYVEGF
ncbi:MAG: maleylacetoacetate isomerase [Parvibaculum sp.]|uniref:maleylacetoacetate isomerase n=1 Tax=Parvibaculum sp. TaxID=2024848 RepID=UPI002AB83032|nr:maleylacetoacetate isomerase [Parvibaculum sp.]MDZ4380843.1 maleylacetoacetate isomerase [Parvibaculum sp.]